MTKIEDKYKKLTQRQHVLERPGMYIGSVKKHSEELWVNKETEDLKMEKIVVEYSPGFMKIFDEILTNATDHSFRDTTVTTIKVEYSKETGEISVWNNGQGIPIEIHQEHNMYVPELIFGNLLSGSNYDDTQKRTGAGTFGIGSKAVNIYSKKFTVETVDSKNKQKYIQVFSENMTKKTKPKITASQKQSYVKISFIPDYPRFEMNGLETDAVLLIRKRVLDCIACTNDNVAVYLNGEKMKGKGMPTFIKYFFENEKIIYEKTPPTNSYIWEYAIVPYDHYEQVSFVNGNATIQGGKHVDYILYQILNKLKKMIEEKKKIKDIKVNTIKDKMFLFLRATIENPVFNSQTKEQLTTPSKDFGCSVVVSDAFITKLYKSSITDDIIELCKLKDQKDLAKITDGRRKSTIRIPKLDDATFAGTTKSQMCSLILTEGDSARGFAVAGLSIIGREKYGIYPLRGKCLNVREATQAQLLNNEEVNNLKKILGLQHGKKYTDTSSLRYGSVIILADQDVDGSHITSLIINIFHYWFPELLEIKGFLKSMKTPIIKAQRLKESLEFYTIQDFKNWEKIKNVSQNWTTKYYKGLGTSTAVESKTLFKKMDSLVINYISSSETEKYIKLAFEKKQADNRKEWLRLYDSSLILDQIETDVSYADFINKNLIHFSMYDVIRSIPSICDGLKPSQRKVMFGLFKKKYTKEIKVAQLAAAVSEISSYHHGEASLSGTIVCLAQNHIGTNNCNLLNPNGNFGSRISTNNSASPRYIFTELSNSARELFNPEDFNILKYLEDDGMSIEPEFYIPLLPIVLLNGAQGIGTGFSTFIPSFNPKDIISNIKSYLKSKKMKKMTPWFNKFKGRVEPGENSDFMCYGSFQKINSKTLLIDELPIHTWTDDYKEFLENTIEKKDFGISGYTNNSTDEIIHFELKFTTPKDLENLLLQDTFKKLKLTKNISTKNMHLFDEFGSIKKYESPEEILEEFIKIKLKYNQKRKEYLAEKYTNEIYILKSKTRFLQEIINGTLVIYKKSKKEISFLLEKNNYIKVASTYDYLVSMPIYSFTLEKIQELFEKTNKTQESLNDISSKTSIQILGDDLDHSNLQF